MKVNTTGIKLIKSYEQQSNSMKGEVEKKIEQYEGYVSRIVTSLFDVEDVEDVLNENQFSALVSFGIGVGLINLKKTIVKALESSQSEETLVSSVSAEFQVFNKVDNKLDKTLMKRRYEEKKLYDTAVECSYTALVTDLKTSVRKGAGKKYDKTGRFFSKGDIINILRTNSAKTWGLTDLGWISLKYIRRV